MLLKLVFVLMVLFAVFAVQTHKLRRAVVYLGIFSLISSFGYLLYSAPDVAIAEAIIGSTLATILYLVALQKYRVFTIYYTNEDYVEINDSHINKARESILSLIERFCIEKELEPQVIYTPESLQHIQTEHQYDLIVRQGKDAVTVYGNKENYQLSALREYIRLKGAPNVTFVATEEC